MPRRVVGSAIGFGVAATGILAAWTPSPTCPCRPTSRSTNTHLVRVNAPGSPKRSAPSPHDPIDLPHVIGGNHRMGGGATRRCGPAAPALRAAGHLHQRRALRRDRRDRGGDRRQGRLGGHPVRRARRGVPARRRPAGRTVAGEDRRGHHAGPVQDRLPGRDRHAVRARRLLAVQRRVRPADPGAAADQQPRRVEPHRPPSAGGLRLRDHAVQLHRDRGQPADRPRADGQHGGVEAVADTDLRRLPDHAAAGGRGSAAGCDQPAYRRRHRGFRCGACRSAAGRDPLHRIDGHVPAPVARGRRQHRPLPHLSAAGRRDRRQGLRGRARVGAPGCAAHGADSRRVRLPGPEVLGGVAGVHPALGLAADGRRLPCRPPRRCATATSPT